MDAIIQHLVYLSKNSQLSFAIYTVLITGTAGALMAASMELLINAVGIKTDISELGH